jgi:hypothetical protein
MILSGMGLYRVYDGMGNGCGTLDNVKIREETKVFGENLPEHHFFRHKSHITCPAIKTALPWWEASNSPPEVYHGACVEIYFN